MENDVVNIKTPKDIEKMLLSDEQVLLTVKQSRWKAMLTPDTIIFTNQRVMRYSPSGFLGWRKDIEDYRYEDIANFKVTRGIMFATVKFVSRFLSESLVLEGLPNGQTSNISRIIEQNIRRVRTGVGPQAVDPLEVLKLRFARGEITREQFEEMKRTLD